MSKQPIGINLGFLATALSVAMQRLGVTELTFTKDEFDKLNLQSMGIRLDGEFERADDDVPASVTFHSVPREGLGDVLH